VELGSGNYKSQSTTVPVNGAYILSEDQNGVGAQFGASRNYFDYNNGKNTIATTSETFVTAVGNFSTAEQDSLVSQQLTGVCTSSSRCIGSNGLQTTFNSYRLYPMSNPDMMTRPAGTDGKFFTASSNIAEGAKVSTATPTGYRLRSSDDYNYVDAPLVSASAGTWDFEDRIEYPRGFRPAGVLNLESVLLSESRTDSCVSISVGENC
jgi:hypothetical protein